MRWMNCAGSVIMDWVIKNLNDCGYTGPLAVEYEGFGNNISLPDARVGLQSWLDFLRGY